MTGIVFAKFTKPTHRGKTIVFSSKALVTMRNGAFYLLCRQTWARDLAEVSYLREFPP